MFLQNSVKDCRVEYVNCINGPSVNNDKHIALAFNPYDYYNNRFSQGEKFSEGENGQHSDNQKENIVKERAQKADFHPLDAELCRNSLQVGLFQPNLAQTNDDGKSIPNGHKPICIPLKMIMPLVPFENDGVIRGHTECNKDMSKWSLSREEPLENIDKNDMHDYSRKQKLDGEAIVDLAANTHNRWNRTIHDYLWCPFVLYFVFVCCAPAILIMHKSDIAFRKGRDSEARQWAICSSILYGIGLVLTLAFYATIFTLVFVYTK
ncbi:hypothetical protein CHS0354_038102 [Potamilus streckersoni]|uniref:Uncharacterized protein n=1 Tax=Potamilus streckersoni TaxID=2493646 RepID=A0AAE0SJD1_9BIVA|nr:hypothetical protein CHS0354_038102 [Potamilus streckersoni]